MCHTVLLRTRNYHEYCIFWQQHRLRGGGQQTYSRVAKQRRDSTKKQMWLYHMPFSPLYISNSVSNFSRFFVLCLSSTTITIISSPLSFLHPECTYFNLMFTCNRVTSFTFVLMQPTSFFTLSFLKLKFSI